MAYTVEFKPSAARALAKLPRNIQRRITTKVDALPFHPRPPGVETLKGKEGLLRIRVGDYQIIYQVHDKVLLILVVRIGHRREIYKGLD